MPPKRKRSESLTHDAAQALIRRLMTPLLADSAEDDAGSKVTYAQAAPLVGLDPDLELQDIATFKIHRSRIPTDLFKSIVVDMDVMMVQYGPLHVHKTDVARSRFFSPIFNHLVKQFNFMLRNNPETITTGTRGRIEYFFKAFGAVAILCIEMKPRVGNEEERLDAVAQVITECDGCDLNNAKGKLSPPILCILSDGLTFEFFKFERAGSVSSFFRGCFPGDPEPLQHGLTLPDSRTADTPLPFILQLRCVCETIFDTMLSAYIFTLSAYRDRSVSTGKREGVTRPSFDDWDTALKCAKDALETFRYAEALRKDGDVDSADESVLEGLHLLHESTGAVPTVYKSKLLMTGWDENAVKKA